MTDNQVYKYMFHQAIIGIQIVNRMLKNNVIMSENICLNHLNADEFDSAVLSNKNLSVVVFYTEWCGSYFMLLPILKVLSKEYEDRVSFFSMDFEINKQLAVNIGVINVPTMLFFRDGKLVDKLYGVEPKVQLIKRIEQWL